MSRRVIPKGLITNQPASSKGATWYRGVGALNRSVYRHLLINATLPQPFPPTTTPTIGNLVLSHTSLAFEVTSLPQNAQYYEYSLDNGANWTQYNVLNIGGEPYVSLTGLTDGQTYTVVLRGVGRAGPGPASNALSGTVNNQGSLQQINTAGAYALMGPAKGTLVSYIIVGGGGGGGSAYDVGAAGGGGGGMVRTGSFVADGTVAYTLTVGAGGLGGSKPAGANQSPGNPGQDSSITGGSISISSLGGLGGDPSRGTGAGGSQSIPPSTAATGGKGGGGGAAYGAGGGGGAGGDGGSSTTATGGAGGVGLAVSLGGSSGTFGAGGIGATRNDAFTPGVSAASGTGNGGGGASATSNSAVTGYPSGGNGGSGRIWVYY
jgi:hypothetical protein